MLLQRSLHVNPDYRLAKNILLLRLQACEDYVYSLSNYNYILRNNSYYAITKLGACTFECPEKLQRTFRFAIIEIEKAQSRVAD